MPAILIRLQLSIVNFLAYGEPVSEKKTSYDYQDLLDCAHGKLFGPGNAQLPLPPMLLFDRNSYISDEVEVHGKGVFTSELDVRPVFWFFGCNFEGTPVMPGCLGL